jgi:hypothetical protein
MAAVPMKSEYGPTLGRLLEPRWRAASRGARSVLIVAIVALVALVVSVALTFENSHYSHGGPVRFGFSYRSLYRTTPDPGGYVRVQAHGPGGALRYSFAVDPLQLPPYSGEVFGELPIYASEYIRQLAKSYKGFVLRGEGKSRVNVNLTGYQVLYTADLDGQEVYGRNVMLLPHGTSVRKGVVVVMLTSSTASANISSPLEVAGSGVLLRPLKTFSFD